MKPSYKRSIYDRLENPRPMKELDKRLSVLGIDKVSIFYPLGNRCTIVFIKEDKRNKAAHFLLKYISDFGSVIDKRLNYFIVRLSRKYPLMFGYAVRMEDDYNIPGIGIRIAKERLIHQLEILSF